jgi:hypothetical protein
MISPKWFKFYQINHPLLKNLYKIDVYGNIKDFQGNDVKVYPYKGYLFTTLMVCREGTWLEKQYSVHRLVARTFKPVKGMDHMHVHHLDEDKMNAFYLNLHWLTPSDHAIYHNGQSRKSAVKNLYRACVEKYGEDRMLIILAKLLAR